MERYIHVKYIYETEIPHSFSLSHNFLLHSGRSYISFFFFLIILFHSNSSKTLLTESLEKGNLWLLPWIPVIIYLPPVHLKSFSAHISPMCIYLVPSFLLPQQISFSTCERSLSSYKPPVIISPVLSWHLLFLVSAAQPNEGNSTFCLHAKVMVF